MNGNFKKELTKEEIDKCKASPLYFYNTYATVNGKKVKPVTQEEYDAIINQRRLIRNRINKSIAKYPLLSSDCIEIKTL